MHLLLSCGDLPIGSASLLCHPQPACQSPEGVAHPSTSRALDLSHQAKQQGVVNSCQELPAAVGMQLCLWPFARAVNVNIPACAACWNAHNIQLQQCASCCCRLQLDCLLLRTVDMPIAFSHVQDKLTWKGHGLRRYPKCGAFPVEG